MKRWTLIVLIVLAAVVPLTAQSNAFLDRLLEKEEATVGDAAYLVLVAAGRLGEEATAEEAAAALARQGWRLRAEAPGEAISLGSYAYLLMQAFQVKGGLMYHLLPGPRYAARELAYLKIVKGKAAPDRRVRGEEMLQILRRLLEWKEGLS
jgi:hypothetical protein